ncbi:MAG: endonuclease NucS [Trichodesmium sp. MO_231.B1]|nr:endonuclease NucS [Trichodesmium sp. MO_231.B1]
MPYLKSKHLTKAEKKQDEKVAKSTRNLVLINDKIKFQSEEDLENYIEENFNQIFPDLVLIKRQYTINTQRCDLLCSTKLVKQPVIIELKNEEDRGLISQLTRYRKALLIEKPFAEQIDYSLPVKLIAIRLTPRSANAPIFHEDNYTDQEASKFEDDFCLWEFSIDIQQNQDIAQFNLSGKTYDIPYPIFGLAGKNLNSESYSKSLPTFAWEFYFRLDKKYEKDFQALRNQLIAQPKIKEMVSTSYRKVLYGTGEGKNHKKLA